MNNLIKTLILSCLLTVVSFQVNAQCIELELVQEATCNGTGNMDLFIFASNAIGGTVYFTDFAGNQTEAIVDVTGIATATLPNTYYNVSAMNLNGETECTVLLTETCDACDDLDIYNFSIACVPNQESIQFYCIVSATGGAQLQIQNAVTGNIAFEQAVPGGSLISEILPNSAYTVSIIGNNGCDIVFDLPEVSCESLPCTPFADLDEESFTAAYHCDNFQDFTYYFSGSYNTNSSIAYSTQFIILENETIVHSVGFPDFWDLNLDGFQYENYCLAIINYHTQDGLIAEVGQAFSDISNDAGLTISDGACFAVSDCINYGPPISQFVYIYDINTNCISADSFTLTLEVHLETFSPANTGELNISDGVYSLFMEIDQPISTIEVTLPNNGNDYYVDLFNWEVLCEAFEIVSVPNCDPCENFITAFDQGCMPNESSLSISFVINPSDAGAQIEVLDMQNLGELVFAGNVYETTTFYEFFDNSSYQISVTDLGNGCQFTEIVTMCTPSCFEITLLDIPTCVTTTDFEIGIYAPAAIGGTIVFTALDNTEYTSIVDENGFATAVIPNQQYDVTAFSTSGEIACAPLTIDETPCDTCGQNLVFSFPEIECDPDQEGVLTFTLIVDATIGAQVQILESLGLDIIYDVPVFGLDTIVIGPLPSVEYIVSVTDFNNCNISYDIPSIACIPSVSCDETNPFLIPAFDDLTFLSSEVIQCSLPDGSTVYVFEECASAFDGYDYSIYDCEGNFLCGYGGFNLDNCDEYLGQLTYVNHYWDGYNDEALDIICIPTDCYGELLGSAQIDACGNCLSPDDPNFDACITCDYTNPLTDLDWLANEWFIGDALYSVKEYEYNGEIVFFAEICETIPDGQSILYDCEGNYVCAFGGIAGQDGEECPGFPENATFINEWQVCGGSNCNASAAALGNPLATSDCFSTAVFIDGTGQFTSNLDADHQTLYLLVDDANNIVQFETNPYFGIPNITSVVPNHCMIAFNYYSIDGANISVGQAVESIANNLGQTINTGACFAVSNCQEFDLDLNMVDIYISDAPTCISTDSFTVSLEAFATLGSNVELFISGNGYFESYTINVNTQYTYTLPSDIGQFYTEVQDNDGCINNITISSPDCGGAVCDFTNPITDLDWLANAWFINDGNMSIQEFIYEGETVFFADVCVQFPDAQSVLYDCEGNYICAFGGIAGQDGEECPGFPENATLVNVWKECGADLCDESNPFLIPALVDLASNSFEVIQCTTPNGMTVYLFEECAAAFDGFDYSIYDCQGGFLCGQGGFFPSTCDAYIDELTYVQHYWAGFNDATLDLSCTPLDCNGVLLGSALFDECGNCLSPNDPDFDNCSYEESYTTCTDSIITASVDGIDGYSMPGFFIEPQSGVFDFSTPTGGGLDFTYTPSTGFNGNDTIGITWLSDTDPTSIVQYFYINVAPCDEVWPGDVNNNGLANNVDIIYLGLEYNSTGDPRPNATSNWEGQLMTDWDDEQIIGVNTKFADCTGDGSINLADRDVILQNYGQEHDLGKTSAEGIPLFANLPNMIQEGEAITIPIVLGNMDEMVENFYGVAFTINFPSEYVEEDGIDVDFTSLFLGTADETVMGLDFTHFADGKIDVGISKIDEMMANGYGDIAYLSIVMIDDIIGKTDSSIPFTIDITDITAISRDGSEVEIQGTLNETEITLTGIEPLIPETPISFYPNPATNYLIVEGSDIQNIQIFDINGRVKSSQQMNQQTSVQIDLSDFSNGVYLLELEKSDGNRLYKKIEVMK